MKPKTLTTLYWIFTIIFALLVFLDGIGGVTRQQAGIDVLKHLGYPVYLMTIAGVARLLAVVALLQTKFKVIKEWAFAGIAINFVCAFASRTFVGDSFGLLIPPVIMLAFLFIPYTLWKKVELIKQSGGEKNFDCMKDSHKAKSY
ncbi:DoxX family protein [Mucilaginibacter sp.]|uniref:DoxX family protein n=1 Tax=Mucilaginibacter sp. TaxID=1882438 RepID=UPI0026063938|nr:DoxX family protein [Mucilaginibacter sp.]MDB4918021.1 DoxX family protein [Mucilaginibacter sp.]